MAYRRASYPSASTLDLGLAVATTGGSVLNMVNWGVSVISNTSAEVYVLAPPVAGCKKTLVFTASSSTVATAVKLSTNTAQTVTIVGGGNAILNTVIKKAATASTLAATVVELTGYNSTSWILTSAWPPSTAPSATNFGGMVTLSTT